MAVFPNTKGSLLLVMLLHCSINTAAGIGGPNGLVMSGTFVVMAGLLILATRGRLSYGRYRRDGEVLALPSSVQKSAALMSTAISGSRATAEGDPEQFTAQEETFIETIGRPHDCP